MTLSQSVAVFAIVVLMAGAGQQWRERESASARFRADFLEVAAIAELLAQARCAAESGIGLEDAADEVDREIRVSDPAVWEIVLDAGTGSAGVIARVRYTTVRTTKEARQLLREPRSRYDVDAVEVVLDRPGLTRHDQSFQFLLEDAAC